MHKGAKAVQTRAAGRNAAADMCMQRGERIVVQLVQRVRSDPPQKKIASKKMTSNPERGRRGGRGMGRKLFSAAAPSAPPSFPSLSVRQSSKELGARRGTSFFSKGRPLTLSPRRAAMEGKREGRILVN